MLLNKVEWLYLCSEPIQVFLVLKSLQIFCSGGIKIAENPAEHCAIRT